MEAFMSYLEMKLMPAAMKISSQRHMQAIRSGIIATLPLTIVGSFFTVLLNLPVDSLAAMIEPYRAVLDIPFRYTVGLMSLYCTFTIAQHLANTYKIDSTSAGLLAVLAFLISTVVPTRVIDPVEGVIGAGRFINLGALGSSSLFAAIVTSIAAVEILKFMKEKNWTIKMPEGVPPEVANSFAALLPTAVVIFIFVGLRYGLNFDINGFLSMLLMPLKGLLTGNSLLGGLLTVFLIVMFWVMGIHGPAILGPIIRPFWDMSIAENMEAFAAGVPADQMPNIFTEQFIQWFAWIGGSGGTLALVVMFMFSKSKFLKKLGRLSFVPGLFNINEPIIFGAPIVMNPILAIPFIIAPMVMTTIAYIALKLGIIPMMVARLPFTVLAPIAAWMSTDWTVMAGVIVLVNFVVSFLIYYPFFKVFERQQLEKEKEIQGA
ncbi:PTS sugar transporter subunit IIC [Erysipelothrix urinaevulpis]|uniref:PTS sugar transporter subunit IIC n=1 Tax=Erysipelothrix urinaevulpis TaxID=2683717 RepID=UPI001357DF83|nr:PTS transporter subunit EIIC [Erysipelothrix urinaevulpis]